MHRPQKPDVVVVGDEMLDRYLVGAVERISPEAPVPVRKVSSSFDRPGGAACVAANVESLGAAPRRTGRIGSDESAAILRRMLGEIGIPDRWLLADASCVTTNKTRRFSGQYQIARGWRVVTPVLVPRASTTNIADTITPSRAERTAGE